jgi:hypothetical protein
VSTHVPAAPAAHERFRAEHLLAIAAALLIIFTIGAATSSLPQGTPVGTTCAWHGSRLVVSGGLINTGMSSAQFRVNTTIRIAERRHAIFRSAIVDLDAVSADRWSSTYTYTRKGLVGNAITACTARVRTIPPPSGED